MLNIRKQDSTRANAVPAKAEPAPAPKSVYDRYPAPRDAGPLIGSAAGMARTPDPFRDDGPTDFVIGRGTRLKGEIEAGGDVIVEGEVEASIQAATIRVHAGGSVSGDVNVTNAEVRGRFEGTLNVAECLTLTGDGHVSGTIRYRELKVDKGARLTGDIGLAAESVSSQPARAKTQAEKEGAAGADAA